MKHYFIRLFFIAVSLWCSLNIVQATEMSTTSNGKIDLKNRIVFGGDENYPPFIFRDDEGNPAGYHVDLIRAIGDALGYQVDIQLDQWKKIRKKILIDKTINVTSLAYQKQREKIFLFSTPHLIESSVIYIRKYTQGIESIDDLIDKEIIVMKNATTYMNLKDMNFRAKFKFVDAEPEALLLLAKGKHDAAIVGRHMGLSVVQRYNLKKLITVGEPMFPREYVFATALGRQDLMDEINRGLKKLKSNGRYDKLNRKWFITAQEQGHLLKRILHYGVLVIASLLFLASLSIVWSWTLKKKVNEKTSALQAELTERKRTEVALIESEAKFRALSKEFKAILDGVPGILALFDKKLDVVWCNKDEVNDSNFPSKNIRSEVYNNEIKKLLAIQNQQKTMQTCFTNGCEIDYLNTDKKGRTWEIRGFPMKNAKGVTTHFLLLATDITENIQLREEAIAASRLASLGELSAGVAHEINNPTGLILLYLPFIRDFIDEICQILDLDYQAFKGEKIGGLTYERARSEVSKSLYGAIESANRIKNIVEELKDFVRQDAVDMTETVDINRSVRTALRLTNSLIRKSTDSVKVEFSNNSLMVEGNVQRIEQVLINLIQNACYAIESRKGAIFLKTKYEVKESKIIVEIQDDGCGMDSKTLGKITDPFFTTRRESGGTGIGLSISARIIGEHGGKLEYKSSPGKGTLARVIFPERRHQ